MRRICFVLWVSHPWSLRVGLGFVRYLRALRPGKAAEVLEAIRTDPQFEDEFRRVPQEAPAGTKTRSERLLEEFKKAP